MFGLVAELGRRNVVRVAAIYIGIAWATIHAGTILGETWDAPHWVMRKTERFKTLVRNAGLVDYWRARGWPDLCHPAGADDFVCD